MNSTKFGRIPLQYPDINQIWLIIICSANKMKTHIIIISILLSANAFAQELKQYDAYLLRSKSDLVEQATKEKLAEFSQALGLKIIDWRSYQALGSTNYYLHAFRVDGPNASLVNPNLLPDMKYSEAIIKTFREFMPQKVVQSSKGKDGLIYIAGFSANDGSSLGCIFPAQEKDSFIHITANSVGFMEGTDFNDFDLEFRKMIEILLEKQITDK